MDVKVTFCVMVMLFYTGIVGSVSVKGSSLASGPKDSGSSGPKDSGSEALLVPGSDPNYDVKHVKSGGIQDDIQNQDKMEIAALREDMKLQNGLIENLINRMERMETREHDLNMENECLHKRISYLEIREKQGRKEIAKLARTVRIQQRSLDSLVDLKLAEKSSEYGEKESEHDIDVTDDKAAQKGQDEDNGESVDTVEDDTKLISTPRKDRAIKRDGQPTAVERRQIGELTNVAFFAALTEHHLELGVDQIIPFDHIITNAGNAYNGNVGHFEAPFAGTYLFSVTIVAYSSHVNHYYFSKNGNKLTNINVDAAASPYASASQTAVLELEENDVVTVRNVESVGQLYGQYYSTFSGCLVYQNPVAGEIVGKRSAPVV